MSKSGPEPEPHRRKRNNVVPYIIIIVVAVILISIANIGAVYYSNQVNEKRDHIIINNQEQLISSLSTAVSKASVDRANILNNTQTSLTVDELYHGVMMMQLSNISKSLNNLIIAHNEMIKAIEDSAAVHTPTIIKNTIVKNNYCTVNEVYVPPNCKHK